MTFRGGNHRYCDDCRDSREHAHFCHNCGKFINNYKGHGQKYCDSCSVDVRKERKKIWEENYREYGTHFCVNCGKPIYGYQGHGQNIAGLVVRL